MRIYCLYPSRVFFFVLIIVLFWDFFFPNRFRGFCLGVSILIVEVDDDFEC